MRRLLLLLGVFFGAARAGAHSLVKADMQLANNAVLAMCQDEDGNMWIGTYDGLHLYNGKNTFVFRMELDNERSLCSNIVQEIVPAEKGYLWVATSLGVNKFSLRERCVMESYMQYVDVTHIASDSAGNAVCFSEPDFISCYRRGSAFFEDVYMPGVRAAEVAVVWAEGVGQFCTLTTDGRLVRYRFGTGGKTFDRVSERQLARRTVHKAFYHRGKLYYVDTAGILWCYSCKDEAAVMLSDLSTLGETGFTCSSVCPFDGDVYVGFFAGALGRVPGTGGTCELIGSDHRIFCLWHDERQDILWVGTDGYGAYMYCERNDLFTALLLGEQPLSMFKPVRAIRTDADGDLWIGTKGDGVVRIRDYQSCVDGRIPPPGRITRFDRNSGLTSNEVFGFCRSAWREVLWIATSGPGLSYYSYKEDRVRPLPVQPGMEPLCKAHQICEVNDSTLYVASDTEALVELTVSREERPTVRSMHRYRFRLGRRECNEFYALIRESDSTLLLGMRGGYGVIRFNMLTKRYAFVDLDRLQSRALGDVLCLCKSSESGLYCGTSSGLIRMTPDGDIRQSNSRSGIVNDMVHGVLEDVHGCIWLSTNKGLAQYNPESDSFHNYSASDLPVIEFCDDAYWKCPYTGRLFFGGVNGVVWIDPSSEAPADYQPRLRFMDIELPDGTLVPLHDYSGEAESGEKPVRIAPRTTSFHLSFVAVDYLNGDNYEYSYCLEGLSDAWIALQKDNRITFTNLPAGNYRLHVRYKSNVMGPMSRIYTLPLVVLPPWYRTTAAILAYIAALLAAVGVFLALLRGHYRREQRRVVARIEEEQREKLSEARLNFFVNISHELCTPLTLINGMNERIAQLAADDCRLQKYVAVMDENVRGLNSLIQEILDFRKIEEAGFGRVRIRRIDLVKMLSMQVRSFMDAAERSGIELLLETPAQLAWNTDETFFKKIVSNLLSNALKYTPADGSVRIVASATKERMTLEVRNTGRGIEPEQLEHLFDRYRVLDDMDRNMFTDTASRNGLGLFICRGLVQALGGEITASSEVGRFTAFTVSLPAQELCTEEPADAAKPAVAPPRDRKPEILVVDDNKDIRWLIESALSQEYRVHSCSTVAEAFARLDAMTPELIITDIVMADTDGLEFISAVRADKFLCGIPIVVVSAKVSEDEQATGLQAGADAYLTKPFSVLVLLATVQRLLNNRRTLKAYYNAPESAYTVVEGQQLHQTEKAFMDAVVDAVQEQLESENLRMEQIAGRLGLTPRNFYRKFKKISGRTPSEFIKEFRFESAARLLLTTDLTIQEIMYRVGISNKSYFYREFQKKYGVKPKEYRLKR